MTPTAFRLACLLMAAAVLLVRASEGPKPNILWLTSEDHGPHMGCYGDAFASTPNVDRLAAQGMIYTRVWSVSPVCAPARTALISGMYPESTGSEHMRSLVPFPAGKKMFPQYLRDAGYYCSNNAKEDYNLAKPGRVLGRLIAQRTLAATRHEPAVLRCVQLREESREQNPHAPAHATS
jgi:hypothetical protein